MNGDVQLVKLSPDDIIELIVALEIAGDRSTTRHLRYASLRRKLEAYIPLGITQGYGLENSEPHENDPPRITPQ